MTRISAILIVRNAESTVGRCLDSFADIVDEIIVVDGNSFDNTVQICRNYTDNIFSRKPRGYVESERNYAISKSSGDWILYIDADEYLSKDLRNSLRELCESSNIVAYQFLRINIHFSRPIIHGVFSSDYQNRLYRKDCVHYLGRLHEFPIISGNTKRVDLPILHNQSDANKFLTERMVRYAIIKAGQRTRKSGLFYLSNFLRIPYGIFSRYYIKKKGYLDGLPGLFVHIRLIFELLIENFIMALFARKAEQRTLPQT